MRIKISLIFSLLIFTVSMLQAQTSAVTVSGMIKGKADKTALPFVNIVLKTEKDSAFVTGTVSNDEGRFTLTNIKPGNYVLQFSYTGFASRSQPVLAGSLSRFLDLGTIELQQDAKQLLEVAVSSKQDDVSNKMDKKTYSVAANISQGGGSVLSKRHGLACS